MSLHLLYHLLVRHAEATETASVIKETACESCGAEYVYRMRRSARGRTTGFLVADQAGARAEARRLLDHYLAHECDPVPCPACGWYQAAMVPASRRRLDPHVVPTAVFLAVVGVLLVVVGLMVSFVQRDVSVPAGVLLVLGAACLLSAVALPICRLVRCRRFDPNALDQEARLEEARARAVFLEDYLAGAARPPEPTRPQRGLWLRILGL